MGDILHEEPNPRKVGPVPNFKYEMERVPGMGTWYRWHCPKCERRGELQLDHEFAKQDARESHGYGGCPEQSR